MSTKTSRKTLLWAVLVVIASLNITGVITTVRAMLYDAPWSPVFTIAVILSWIVFVVLTVVMLRIWRRIRSASE